MVLRIRHFVLALAGVLALAAIPAGGARAQDDQLPDGPGKATLTEACTQCHGTGQITAQRRTPDEWADVVSRMVGVGAIVSDQQHAEIVAYLSANYGKA